MCMKMTTIAEDVYTIIINERFDDLFVGFHNGLNIPNLLETATLVIDISTTILNEETFNQRKNELTVELHQGLNITDLLFDFYNSSSKTTPK